MTGNYDTKKDNIIEFQDVSFAYEEKTSIVEHFDLKIAKGEFIAILGLNGCGKSTIAKHINGILRPTDGHVLIEGLDTANAENLPTVRSKVGMVFQNPDNQFVTSIVEEDIAFGPENYGVGEVEILRRVEESLNKVGMSAYAKHSPQFLSGGQKQRIAIAGVMAIQPDIVVFDESTAMLDPKGRDDVLKAIQDLNQNSNITVVLITHYMEEAALADRIAIMDGGKVISMGIPSEVFSDVGYMKDLGLDVPQIRELAFQLRQEGVPLDPSILSVDGLVDALSAVLTEKAAGSEKQCQSV